MIGCAPAMVALALAAAPLPPFTLEGAVSFALEHHPAVRAQIALEHGAEADVAGARAALLPRLDASLELERSTGNVVAGSAFALPGMPLTSGPAGTRDFDSGTFGSAISLSAGLDVVALLRRMDLVDASLADRGRAKATTDVRRLAIAAGAAQAFLELAGAQEALKAARAAVARATSFATQTDTLVAQELRPGADASRARAEIAAAGTLLARAQQAVAVRRAQLGQALGLGGESLTIDAGALARLPVQSSDARQTHPLLVEARQVVVAAGSRQSAMRLEFLPRIELAGALWARGTGYDRGGTTPAPLGGLVPNTPNWGTALIIAWPVLELFSVRAKEVAATASLDLAHAREDEVAQIVASEIEVTRAQLEGAKEIAARTIAATDAARTAEQQASARFAAGLGTALEVADAQRLLAQAELDDASGRLGVWTAMFLLSRALGDLEPFLAQTRSPQGS